MQILAAEMGDCADVLMFYYVYILMKGDKQ